MVADLINIDNIVLANDFEKWLDRTNEVIDALNPLQIYDLDDTGANIQNPLFVSGTVPAGFSLGLQFYRDIRFDGDMLIEVHAEPPLGFDAVTGALELSFIGPFAPPPIGGTCIPPDTIDRVDLFLVYDASAGVTKMVEAQNMLPLISQCDHQFGETGTPVTITIKGDLVVDGTQTILNTTQVESLDNKISLNATPAILITDASNYVGGEDLVVGETVTGQTSGETAIVFSWIPAAVGNPGSLLVVTNRTDPFTAGEVITGGTSGFSVTENSQVDEPDIPAGNDTIANGGGICLLSSSLAAPYAYGIQWQNAGDRWFINDASWEIDQNFDLFTTTIETQTGILELQGGAAGTYLTIPLLDTSDANFPGPTNHWEWRAETNPVVEGGTGAPVFPYTPGNYPIGITPPTVFSGTLTLSRLVPAGGNGTSILFDSVSITNDPNITGYARNLNADLLDGCHASPTPTPFMIPCADLNGEIDPAWIPSTGSIVKRINQTAHGLTIGQSVRVEKNTSTGYIVAQANTVERAEAVGVVENVVDANNFDINLRGCIALTTGEWDAVTTGKPGPDPPGLASGGVYFLDKTAAGNITRTDPSPGDISKTMLIAVDTTTAIVMNYVGGLTDAAGGTPVIDLTGDVLALGLLGSAVTTSIVERTSRQTAVGGVLPLVVQDNDSGSGNRTFEITMTANTTLELQQPAASAVDPLTNSVTLIVHQDGTGGWTPSITISGGGTIAWDNSASQPAVQTVALKTTIYVLVNVNDVPGVWYGSRAVFEI